MSMSKKLIRDRFWSHVDIKSKSECWEWKSYKDHDGYGRIRFGLKMSLAHRVAWILTHGDIPGGFNILHTCDNPPCCNPDHLFKGTPADNSKDMVIKGRSAHHYGSNNGLSKLSENDILEIRIHIKAGYSRKWIAEKYNVAISTIGRISRRDTWSHL